jgi:type I restriction enzyme S subunit
MKLPKGWKTGSVSSLGRLVTGSTPSTADHTNFNGAIPFVTPGDLGGSGPITSAARSLSEQGAARSRLIPRGAALVVCIGSTIGKTGRAGCEVVTNQQINAVIPNPETDGDFVFYEINRIAGQFRRLAGTQAVPILSKSELGDFPVNIPPLPEQRKIADILSAWDEALETLDALIAAKDRQKQALMQQLLTGKTRVKEAKGKWHKKRLDQVFERVERKSPDNPKHILSITAGRGFVDQREKFSRVIAGRNIENYIYLQKGEFSYNKGNSDRYPQGCVYRLEEFEAGAVPNVWISFRIPDESKSNALFYKHFFLSGGLNHELHSRINSGVRNDGLLNLTASNFFTAKVPVPPIEEQEAIGILLEILAQELTLLRTQRQTLDQQKRGLMQRLLTGRIRVKP